MIKRIIALLISYIVFAVSAIMWFRLMGYQPHSDAPLSFKLLTLAYGLFFSLLAGLLVKWISSVNNLSMNYGLAVLIFVLAAQSLAMSAGNHWTQLTAMLAFAPVSILGGKIKR